MTIFTDLNDINNEINNIDFKHSGIFTNSLLKTNDTTQILRDIRDEELVFFQGKKINDTDYETLNNSNLNANDILLKHEFLKLLDDEINNDENLNIKLNNLINFKNLKLDDNDYELIKNIFKRNYIISKIWANPNLNMLDHESNQFLKNSNSKLIQLIEILKDIENFQQLIIKQRNQLNSSFHQD